MSIQSWYSSGYHQTKRQLERPKHGPPLQSITPKPSHPRFQSIPSEAPKANTSARKQSLPRHAVHPELTAIDEKGSTDTRVAVGVVAPAEVSDVADELGDDDWVVSATGLVASALRLARKAALTLGEVVSEGVLRGKKRYSRCKRHRTCHRDRTGKQRHHRSRSCQTTPSECGHSCHNRYQP